MKITQIKTKKIAQINPPTDEKKSKAYTVRDMFRDLLKWKTLYK